MHATVPKQIRVMVTNPARAQQTMCSTKKSIVVAVIDTGLDANHVRFRNHIWTNPGETGLDIFGKDKSDNQIDDDANGFIDDVHGWNFADHSNILSDQHGHGTHIAGLIIGRQNTRDIASADCHPIKLMILKYYERGMLPSASLRASTAAIRYAVKMHARVINFSSGGFNPDANEKAAITKAARANVLLVAAAGNNHNDNDRDGFYPASYKLPNILSVAALDSSGQKLLDFSNYGEHSVNIAAPGENLISTLPGGDVGAMSGTSQATAVVTSVVARFLQLHPDVQSPEDVIAHIDETATAVSNFHDRLISGGKLNPALALEK